MLVFISWSGIRSRAVAEALRTWLKDVMQVLEPWVSSEDIRTGARGSLEVARRLEEAKYGIICLTRENLNEAWVLFEAGALAKTLDRTAVCPYLIDLKPTELQGPLVQFQAACATEADTRRLVMSMNEALGERALPKEQVDRSFKKWWPELQTFLRIIPQGGSPVEELRSERDLIEEILDRIRRATFFEPPLGFARAGGLRDLFSGPDIDGLLRKFDGLGGVSDPNALEWSHATVPIDDELVGWWSSRWNGGAALDHWITGIGRLQVFGDNLYVITHDDVADCLVATRRIAECRLAGRYINLRQNGWVVFLIRRRLLGSSGRYLGLKTSGPYQTSCH